MQTRLAVLDDTAARRVRERHGLFVGIDRYADADQARESCAGDAGRVAAAFEPILASHRVLLDEQGTQRRILTELEAMVQATREDDLMIFYFAGVATTAYNRYFLVPVDYEAEYRIGSMFPFDTVLDVLSGGPCHSLIVVDAANAGAVGFDVATFREARSSILVSCAPNEISGEITVDGERRGAFSSAIVEALSAACAGLRPLTLIELYEQVYAETKRLAPEPQHPILIGTLDYALLVVDPSMPGYAHP